MLLSSGQGGPFQINDYSKRLESGFGLVNFVLLQQRLGYSVADQDSNAQTARRGPNTLEDKYFGPMAAAYFHYNDLLRVEALAATSYYPAASDPTWSTKLANIENFTLGDAAYVAATGVNDTGTFILYPRQVRNYLDQLYRIPTVVVPARPNVLRFSVPTLRSVFVATFSKLGIAQGTSWRAITGAEAGGAFDAALAATSVAPTGKLFVDQLADRTALFDLLDGALNHLQATLGVPLSSTAQVNLALGETGAGGADGGVTCPTSLPVYPSGRGTYVSGTIVRGSDGHAYQCLPGVAAWCNSTAEAAYAPGTGTATTSAWVLVNCP